MKQASTVESYINGFPEEVQSLLVRIRKTIASAVPKSEQVIKYGIPTFVLNGKNLVHFGGFKSHIGFFPGPSGIAAFKQELAKYKTSKGTVQFPLDKPLPTALIKKMVKFRLQEYRESNQ